ncbi:MAG: beta-galactosidase [Acidimicrobiales bacterium]
MNFSVKVPIGSNHPLTILVVSALMASVITASVLGPADPAAAQASTKQIVTPPAGAPTPASAKPAISSVRVTRSSSPASFWSEQFVFEDPQGNPWSEATFATLKAKGLNRAEINLDWAAIEPAPGKFNWSVLNAEEANAAAAGIKLVPIFWQSGWPAGNPAPWADTQKEQTASGVTLDIPAWWDQTEQAAYIEYVRTTVAHMSTLPGFGGAVLDYGGLDAQFFNAVDPATGDGWAPADLAMFYSWLPATYSSLAVFNRQHGTNYSSWNDIPAAPPGEKLASVFSAFKRYSVMQAYSTLTSSVRRIYSGPLYYYFGGHLANISAYGNSPDVFFTLAKKYRVTVILDDATWTGLSILFASLALAYGVPVAQEWTPPQSPAQDPAGIARWLVHTGLLPARARGGEDYFIHGGGSEYTIGFPLYEAALPLLKKLDGSYPFQPVAVFYSSNGSISGVENGIANAWATSQVGFQVVSSSEVNAGLVNLDRFKAILPLNGLDASLAAYALQGGHLLSNASQFSQFVHPYASFANPNLLQVVPDTIAGNAVVLLAGISSVSGVNEPVTIFPSGMGLVGHYHLVDASGGIIPQTQEPAGVCATANIASGQLAQWQLVSGSVPSGTPTAAECPAQKSTPGGHGYWLAAADGGIFSFGTAAFYGSMGTKHLNAAIVGIASTPGGHGYWLAAADGGIFSFGTAAFYGSMGTKHLNAAIVGIASR